MGIEADNLKSNNYYNILPWMPIIGGIAAGTIHNLYNGGWVKSRQFCRSGAFGTVNALKQWEIKNLAFLAPAIPLVLLLSKDLVSGEGVDGAVDKIRNIPMEKVVKTALLVAGTVALVAVFAAVLPVTFDPSGHVMLRLALGIIQTDVIGYLQESDSEWLCLPNGIWDLGDAVQLYNSTAYCHSVAETFAGGAAVAIVAIAAALLGQLVKSEPDSGEPEDKSDAE